MVDHDVAGCLEFGEHFESVRLLLLLECVPGQINDLLDDLLHVLLGQHRAGEGAFYLLLTQHEVGQVHGFLFGGAGGLALLRLLREFGSVGVGEFGNVFVQFLNCRFAFGLNFL